MNRKFVHLILIIIVGALFALFVLSFLFPGKIVILNKQGKDSGFGSESQRTPEISVIKLVAVGDIMLDRGVEYMVMNKGEGDFKFPFLKIADYLLGADILFGNLESVISDKGVKVGSVNSFRAEPESIDGLQYAGFDVVSAANNHALDYTSEALKDSLARLKEAGIDYVGVGFTEEESFSLKIKEIGNTKIGFLAYTNLGPAVWKAIGERPGIAWINDDSLGLIKQDIISAKKLVDVLTVSLHWGDEYFKKPSWQQVKLAEFFIDSGADLIIGHHPHVAQPIERYKEGFIAYSLGNFIFDMGFSEETMKGMILEVMIENKDIKEVIQREIKISPYFQPYINSGPSIIPID